MLTEYDSWLIYIYNIYIYACAYRQIMIIQSFSNLVRVMSCDIVILQFSQIIFILSVAMYRELFLENDCRSYPHGTTNENYILSITKYATITCAKPINQTPKWPGKRVKTHSILRLKKASSFSQWASTRHPHWRFHPHEILFGRSGGIKHPRGCPTETRVSICKAQRILKGNSRYIPVAYIYIISM